LYLKNANSVENPERLAFRGETIMLCANKLLRQTRVLSIVVVALSSIVLAQIETPAAQSAHRFFERRAELIRQHRKNAGATPVHQNSQPLRSSDAPVASQRYVFGRLDVTTGLYPLAVATGVFKTGGPVSIAVANYDADTVSIYLSNGDGTFQPRVDYETSFAPDFICVGDFNGDKKQDLAVADWASDTVSVFLGNGDGTFQPRVDYSVGAGYVSSVVAADLNHDGKLDLVATSEASDSVIILLGNGDGTFQPPTSYAAGNDADGVVVADFNGDGLPDLAVTVFTDQVAIFLGNGDGTFAPAAYYTTGLFPSGIVVGDFNGDHKRLGDQQLRYKHHLCPDRQRRRHLSASRGLSHGRRAIFRYRGRPKR
jgi:hypothetical protein